MGGLGDVSRGVLIRHHDPAIQDNMPHVERNVVREL